MLQDTAETEHRAIVVDGATVGTGRQSAGQSEAWSIAGRTLFLWHEASACAEGRRQPTGETLRQATGALTVARCSRGRGDCGRRCHSLDSLQIFPSPRNVSQAGGHTHPSSSDRPPESKALCPSTASPSCDIIFWCVQYRSPSSAHRCCTLRLPRSTTAGALPTARRGHPRALGVPAWGCNYHAATWTSSGAAPGRPSRHHSPTELGLPSRILPSSPTLFLQFTNRPCPGRVV